MGSGAESAITRDKHYAELRAAWSSLPARELPTHICRKPDGSYEKWCTAEHWSPIEEFQTSNGRLDGPRLHPRCQHHRAVQERKPRAEHLPPDAGEQISLV